MPLVHCPTCGEDEQLRGDAAAGVDGSQRLVLTCERCGERWDRDTTLRCALCGSEDLEGVATATLREAGRGDQWAPSGVRLVHYCWACGADDVTSSAPRPGPNPPPGNSQDLRALRSRGR